MAHASCPRCEEMGYVINQPSSVELRAFDGDDAWITVCYGEFGVTIH